MIYWRDVRSQEQLDDFTKNFDTLPATEKHSVIKEMETFLKETPDAVCKEVREKNREITSRKSRKKRFRD